MANRLEASVIAKTKAAEKSLKDLHRQVREIGKENKKLGKESARSGKKIEDAYKKGEQAGKRLERQARKSKKVFLGGAVVSQLKSQAAAIGSVAAAWQFAASAIREYNDEKDRAAEGIRAQQKGMGLLAQLAGTDTGRFDDLLKKTNDLRKSFGYSFDNAARLVFDLASLDRENESQLFGLIGTGLANPNKIVGAVNAFAKNFPQQAGSTRDLLDKFIIAAEDAGRLTFEDIAEVSKTAAPDMRDIGGSDTELLALMASMGQQIDPNRAITGLRGLIRSIRDSGLGGQGVMAILETIKRRKSLGNLKNFESEAHLGLSIISKPKTQRAVEEMQRSLDDRGSRPVRAFDAAMANLTNNKRYKANINEQSSKQKLLMEQEETYGLKQVNIETSRNMANELNTGNNIFAKAFSNLMMSLRELTGADAQSVLATGISHGLPWSHGEAYDLAGKMIKSEEREYEMNTQGAFSQGMGVRIENIDELTAASDKSHLSNTESVK